jgi:hypothetical protein
MARFQPSYLPGQEQRLYWTSQRVFPIIARQNRPIVQLSRVKLIKEQLGYSLTLSEGLSPLSLGRFNAYSPESFLNAFTRMRAGRRISQRSSHARERRHEKRIVYRGSARGVPPPSARRPRDASRESFSKVFTRAREAGGKKIVSSKLGCASDHPRQLGDHTHRR